jgi:hypothetical protein
VVLFDLKSNRYFGVGAPQMHSLGSVVNGWPGPGTSVSEGATCLDEAAHALLSTMLQEGVVTEAYSPVRAIPAFQRPAAALIEGYAPIRPNWQAHDLVRFTTAFARTSLEWRYMSLEQRIARIRARKERNDHRHPIDLEQARTLVGIFIRLRPVFYSTRRACLFNSLTLIEFLAAYGVFPTLVIGVQSGPFGAHCWVQDGSTVFDDTPEYVGNYTPILWI